jgi:hypothetical protein
MYVKVCTGGPRVQCVGGVSSLSIVRYHTHIAVVPTIAYDDTEYDGA